MYDESHSHCRILTIPSFYCRYVVGHVPHVYLIYGGANNDLRPFLSARFGHVFHVPLIASYVLREPLSASYK